LQVAVGLNHQLTIGSNFQICLNPAGLLANNLWVPGAESFVPIFGSGIGGNMQLTVGTSASLVYGQVFDINLGPERLELKGGTHKEDNISYALCGVLAAVVLIWVVVYATIDGDRERANEAIIFQILIDLILVALMALEISKKQLNAELEDKRD